MALAPIRVYCVACLLAVGMCPAPARTAPKRRVGAAASPAAKARPTCRRQLPPYEADVYGPMPFSEEVTGFLAHEIPYLLKRQNANGSWDSAQPMGPGRTSMQAGQTVEIITLTSLCGHSLRSWDEYWPRSIKPAVERARLFVTHMIRSGKLRNNRQDAPWHYVYALRFLAREYPYVGDARTKKKIEDACDLIVHELQDMQHGTSGERSMAFDWNRRAAIGLVVEDTEAACGVVVGCDPKGPAHAAGIRAGDRMLTADGVPIDSAARYARAELTWRGGQTLTVCVSRGMRRRTVRVALGYQYPGTLGLKLRDEADGVTVAGTAFLSNRDLADVKAGDRIVSVNGRHIAKAGDVAALKLFAGQEARLVVRRGTASRQVRLVCAPVPAADFGIEISTRYDQGTSEGIAIDRFARGSCLQAAGLRKGDRLLRLDGSWIVNRRHFTRLSRSLWGGKTVRVTALSGGTKKDVVVTAGTLAHERWLKGYHGLSVETRGPAAIASVVYGSPADAAGCRRGDRIVAINGATVDSGRAAGAALAGIPAGKRAALTVLRGGHKARVTFVMHRATDSVWVARSRDAGGGWGYLTKVRGSNTFTTSDALRELLTAKRLMPKLAVPDEMLFRAFRMLSVLRRTQPNSDVASYRYDAAGSFWRIEDIRADIGRLNSAELACLMYCDSGRELAGHTRRTQHHLRKTLREWLKHRGILDLVKFPSDHGKLSIAPWFWMYAHRTTLEAAAYLTVDDELREEVRRIGLKAFFTHMEFRYEPKLGTKGWIIGGDLDKELHDSCQLLDGLATMKHVFRPRPEVTHPALAPALKAFLAMRYGKAYALANKLPGPQLQRDAVLSAQAKLLRRAIAERFATRLADVTAIYHENPYDGLHHLKAMRPHFIGYPRSVEMAKRLSAWQEGLPPEQRPLSPLEKALALREAAPRPADWGRDGHDLLEGADPNRSAIRGRWKKTHGQMISPRMPNARVQLPAAPVGSYQLEVQFTRLAGDCLAVMLPVGRTGVLLVIGGWGGKVSGLAYVDGRDANRNPTTRKGALANGVKHTLLVTTRLLGADRARIDVALDAKDYLRWEGRQASLKPDRAWSLRDSGACGLGAYNAEIVIHSCQWRKAP